MAILYGDVLEDPLLIPLFGKGKPEHIDHLAAFDAESFGGPARSVELYLAAADKAACRTTSRSHASARGARRS
ncbi:MAG TPA: hypothetical protein VFX16_11385 [Pseudonocardiaceae bacterium]|nr:hypothetical protein [Pseudonocardiaceae bacterium]